ncbi:hypothetical protein FOZ60_009127 [Perkinsus olseni]|uniref:DNA/RNA-binding protein Alba-like domain-containing protein n=2 Tax=Perkinsus olseni TaxID=32597 RepID=A0A7J6NK19_PEROL|nr:hypothetical protein FOZ60_009127 [Perkinsus olseni]
MTVATTPTTGVTKTVPEQPVTPEKPTTRSKKDVASPVTEKKDVASPVTEKKEAASPVTEKKEVASPVTEKKEVASPYRRVQRNREEKDPKALAHEVRITVSGGVGLFVKEGVRKLLDTTEGIPEIKVMARGPAIAKAVIVSEMINRMIADLEQDVELGSTDVNDEYVSVDEEHETVVATRIVPFLVVTIRHPKGLIDKSTVSRRPRNTRVPIATKADIAAIKEKEEKAKEDTEGASKRKNRRNRRARRGSLKADVADESTKTEQQVTKEVAEVAPETPKKVEKPEEKEAAPAEPEVAKTAAVETEKGVLLSNSLAGDSADVDFEIRDPEGNIFFEKRDAAEAMFYEKTRLAGEYLQGVVQCLSNTFSEQIADRKFHNLKIVQQNYGRAEEHI